MTLFEHTIDAHTRAHALMHISQIQYMCVTDFNFDSVV